MSSIIHSQAADIPSNMTTTGFDVPGFRIVDNLGVVRGVVVRSRSVFGTVGASLQTMFGGNISLFTELAERTRKQAFDTMLVQAHMAGADAVIGIRYDANELMKGVTEVLCYGTAVRVEPFARDVLRKLGLELSYRFGVTAVLALEEDAVVRFVLHDQGRMVDEYLSVPEYYGPLPSGDALALRANPTVVARLTGADPARVRAVARTADGPGELPPARDLYEVIAELMGLQA